LGKTIALRFEIVRFLKKPALYALKTLNFKLTLPSLAVILFLKKTPGVSQEGTVSFRRDNVLHKKVMDSLKGQQREMVFGLFILFLFV
jgi:hypothetical protein